MKDKLINWCISISALMGTFKIANYMMAYGINIIGIADISMLLAFFVQAVFAETAGLKYERSIANAEKMKFSRNQFIQAYLNNLLFFRSGIYQRCLIFRSNLKDSRKAELLRTGIGRFDFRAHASIVDWVLAVATYVFFLVFIITVIIWLLHFPMSYTNSHSQSYYFIKWWYQTFKMLAN